MELPKAVATKVKKKIRGTKIKLILPVNIITINDIIYKGKPK